MNWPPAFGLAAGVIILASLGITAVIRRKNALKERRLKLFGPPGDDVPHAPLDAAHKRKWSATTPSIATHRDVQGDPAEDNPPRPAYQQTARD